MRAVRQQRSSVLRHHQPASGLCTPKARPQIQCRRFQGLCSAKRTLGIGDGVQKHYRVHRLLRCAQLIKRREPRCVYTAHHALQSLAAVANQRVEGDSAQRRAVARGRAARADGVGVFRAAADFADLQQAICIIQNRR